MNTRGLAVLILLLIAECVFALPGEQMTNGLDSYALLKRRLAVTGSGNLLPYPNDFGPDTGFWVTNGVMFGPSSPDTCPGTQVRATSLRGTGHHQSPKCVYSTSAGALEPAEYTFSVCMRPDQVFADDDTGYFGLSLGTGYSNNNGQARWQIAADGRPSVMFTGGSVKDAGQDSLGNRWWRCWEVVDGADLIARGKTDLNPIIFVSSGIISGAPPDYAESIFLRGTYIVAADLEKAFAPSRMNVMDPRALVVRTIHNQVVPQNQMIGLSYPGDEQYYDISQEAGVGIIRIDAHWRDLQDGTTLAYIDTAGFYGRIEKLESLGIMPYVTFISDNDELCCTFTDTTCYLANGDTLNLDPDHELPLNQYPLDLSQWWDFVNHVVENLNTTPLSGYNIPNPVEYYSVANEWITAKNTNGGFIGSMWDGLYYDIDGYVNTAYSAVKAANHEAKFVMGGGPSTADLGVAVCDSNPATGKYFANWTLLGSGNPTKVHEPDTLRYNYSSQAAVDSVKAIYSRLNFDYLTLHQYGPLAHNYTRRAYWDSVSRADSLYRLSPGDPFPMLCDEGGGPSPLWADSPLDAQYPYRETCDDVACSPDTVTYLALNDTTKFSGVLKDNLDSWANGMPFFMWFRMFMKTGERSPNSKLALCDSLHNRTSGFYAMKHLAALADSVVSVEQYLGQKSAWKLTYEDGGKAIVGISVDEENIVKIEPSFGPTLTYYITDPDSGRYELVPSVTDADTIRIVVGELPVIISQENIAEIQ